MVVSTLTGGIAVDIGTVIMALLAVSLVVLGFGFLMKVLDPPPTADDDLRSPEEIKHRREERHGDGNYL